MDILWQDEHLIFVSKPPGARSQPDPSGSESVLDEVSAHLGRPVKALHRLDRPVGGVMVFACTDCALRALSRQFHERAVSKTYLAVTQGCPPEPDGTLVHYLHHDARHNRSRVVAEGRGKRSELIYRILERLEFATLLEVRPGTGRHHQIRVQLREVGAPILGDIRYGARRPLKSGGIALFARRLELVHPVTGQLLAVEAVPKGPPWSHFHTLDPAEVSAGPGAEVADTLDEG